MTNPTLRDYQVEAAAAIQKELETHRSTMVVMATGLGKTQIFCEMARRTHKRVLVLAHRTELVDQAKKRIDEVVGGWCQVERAGTHASLEAPIVVASVQTIQSDRRLKRFPRDHFGLIIADEFHHFVSRTFKKPLEYFSEAKLLGVTATPDRLDKKGLCSIVESVAYKMDIKNGIDRGWLVPLKGRLVKIDEIDLSAVKKTAGDLQVGELDLAILRAVEGIVQKTMDISDDRQAIVFFPGVASAQFATARFNFLKPDCAAFIGAKTPPIERAHIVHQFKTGRVQYLCNCQVATEGFDAPRCSVIAIARPTLSRALYTQMVGRGVRPHGMPEGLAQDERKGFIATSGKPNCLILDFAGNSGKYSLMSPADVLGADRFTPEEIKQAKKQDEEEPDNQETDPEEGLKQAREELERLARLQKAKVKATEKSFDPFTVLHLNTQIKGLEFGWEPMSPKQRNALLRFGVEQKDVTGYSKKHAKRVLDAMFKRKSLHLASYKQLSLLKKYGHTNPNISAVRASKAIDVIVNSGRDELDRSKLDDILNK